MDAYDDGAELRAVRALLLDGDLPFAFDSGTEDDANIGDRATVSLAVPFGPVPPPPIVSQSTSDSGGSSDTGVAETRASTFTPRDKPRVINRARVRRQKELALLRQQVIALEATLAGHTQGEDTTLLVAWRTVAQDQRTQREAAERERDQLREHSKENRQTVKLVRRALRKHVRSKVWAQVALYAPAPSRSIAMAETDDESQAMVCQLENMYRKLGSAFAYDAAGMDALVDGVANLRIRNDRTPHLTAELRETRALPFDAAATAAALWRFRQSRVATVSVGTKMLEACEVDNELRQSFSTTVQSPSYTGTVHGRVEARRFLMDECFVILHCTRYRRVTQRANEPADAFGCQAINWTIVRPLDRVRPDKPACQLQLVEITTPFRLLRGRDHQGGAGSDTISENWREFSIRGLQFVHNVEKQQIENILLDMARARRGHA